MAKRIVQVRGTTGSGKTTAMRKAIELAGGGITQPMRGNGTKQHVTVTPQFTVTGDYNNPSACVGCDRFDNRTDLLHVLHNTIGSGAERIAFEGMIYSHTYKLATDIARMARQSGYEYSCVFLNVDFETALTRILERNGGKPINYDKLAEKVLRFATAREKIRAAGIRCVDVAADTFSADEVGAIVYQEIMR